MGITHAEMSDLSLKFWRDVSISSVRLTEVRRMTKVTKERDNKNFKLLESVRKGLINHVNEPIPSVACNLVARIVLVADPNLTLRGALQTQLGRSLNSVAANFMEGLGTSDSQQVIRFLKMARGSAYESVVHATCLGEYLEDTTNLADMVDTYISKLLIDLCAVPMPAEEGLTA